MLKDKTPFKLDFVFLSEYTLSVTLCIEKLDVQLKYKPILIFINLLIESVTLKTCLFKNWEKGKIKKWEKGKKGKG
jgi:hypothetical protein